MTIHDQQPMAAERLARTLSGAVSMVAIAGIMMGAIVVVADILGRWFLGTSVYALNEVMSLVFAMAVAATMPAGAAYRVHLKIDLFSQWTGPKVTAWLNVAGSVALFIFFALIAWSVWGSAVGYARSGDATPLLIWPLAPVYFAIATCMGLAALVQAINICCDVARARSVTEQGRTRLIVWIFIAAFSVIVGWVGLWMATDMDALAASIMIQPGNAVLIAFVLLWLGVFLQIPLATVTALIGVVGCFAIISPVASINTFAGDSASFLRNDQVATLPLFLIMGAFAVVAGVSRDLFKLGHVIFGRFKGGLAYTTIAACAGFGAVSGNSVVTSATFGQMALPEMKRLGYRPSLSTATVAAGGTLGALVPPSGVIILFALLTEASIGQLFVAAMVPAILAILMYFAVVFVVVRLNPDAAPAADKPTADETRTAFLGAGPVLGLFTVVIGGLYSGIFNVTESAAVGAACSFFLALGRGRLNRASILEVFSQTTSTVAMIYALIFGGLMFAFFINLGGAPDIVAAWIASIDATPLMILIVLILIYLALGSVMDSFGVMVITVPIVTPIVLGLGYDMLFWGILMLVVVEIGMITPPFGLNLFILKNVDRTVNLGTVMKGVLPFVVADLLKIVLLVAFPALALWLPSTMTP